MAIVQTLVGTTFVFSSWSTRPANHLRVSFQLFIFVTSRASVSKKREQLSFLQLGIGVTLSWVLTPSYWSAPFLFFFKVILTQNQVQRMSSIPFSLPPLLLPHCCSLSVHHPLLIRALENLAIEKWGNLVQLKITFRICKVYSCSRWLSRCYYWRFYSTLLLFSFFRFSFFCP